MMKALPKTKTSGYFCNRMFCNLVYFTINNCRRTIALPKGDSMV